MEAGCKVMVDPAKKEVQLRTFFFELQILSQGPTPMMCNNQSGIKLVKNLVFHAQTKHIETQHYFIREKVQSEDIEVEYVLALDQHADILTKPLGKIHFNR